MNNIVPVQNQGKDQAAQTNRGTSDESVDAVNYISIHGSTPGNVVAGKSTLAAEVTQQLINSSLSVKSVISQIFLNNLRIICHFDFHLQIPLAPASDEN